MDQGEFDRWLDAYSARLTDIWRRKDESAFDSLFTPGLRARTSRAMEGLSGRVLRREVYLTALWAFRDFFPRIHFDPIRSHCPTLVLWRCVYSDESENAVVVLVVSSFANGLMAENWVFDETQARDAEERFDIAQETGTLI